MSQGFSERIASLVRAHVIAKRYLTYKYPEYHEKLSPASLATLNFQGGIMTVQEAEVFEANPDMDLIIRFRHWDDEAKMEDVPVTNIEVLKKMSIQHLYNNALK